jgi:hypothetical protein
MNIRVFIHRTGKINFDKGNLVSLFYIPSYPKISFNALLDDSNHLSIIEHRFKLIAEMRSFTKEIIGLYIDEELLKKENFHFCSFLVNIVEDTIPRKINDSPWEISLNELSYLTERGCRKNYLLENIHRRGFTKENKQQEQKQVLKEKYIRIVDLS